MNEKDLRDAFAEYQVTKDTCTRTGDWAPFADLFTEDVYYVEHAYGVFRGRGEVLSYITRVMAPFPHMEFPVDWVVYDVANMAVVWQVQNRFPPPLDPVTGKAFQFPNISRIVLAGKDPISKRYVWKEEQDWYNPSLAAASTTRAWRKAGGKFESKEKLFMIHDKKNHNKEKEAKL